MDPIRSRGARRRRGSTLVLVVVIGLLLVSLAIVTGTVAREGRVVEAAGRGDTEMSYRCEGAAELLRLELTNHWEQSRLMPAAWFNGFVRDPAATGAAAPRSTQADASNPVPGMAGSVRTYAAFPGVAAWIDLCGPPGQNWVDVVAATTTVGDALEDRRTPQSVRVRLDFGNNPIFDLAMLTVTTNCMFCHMRVNGDVGSIGFLRPGWGGEGSSGANSGNHSFVVGEVYVAPPTNAALPDNVTNDGVTWTDPHGTAQKTLNGLKVLKPDGDDVSNDQATLANNEAGTIHVNYDGPKLPEDTNGDDKPDFPPIDTTVAERQSTGRLGVGSAASAITVNGEPHDAGAYGAWKVPLRGDYASDLTPATPTDFEHTTPDGGQASVVDGNLILIGTYDNPIQLDGDVFVRGDVIIKGYVQGKGGIYAGRNVYVAGDLVYKDTPASWPLKNDGEAVDSIQDEPGTTELRLAARSNIVVGDWTYRNDRDADGAEDDFLPQRDRQGQMFINDQFGMSNTRYYEADSAGSVVSSELTQIGTSYYNDKGEQVPTERVTKVDSTAQPELPGGVGRNYNVRSDRFDAALAPGTVVRANDDGSSIATGSFDPWMSQGEFRSILGTQLIENGVARTGGVENGNDATKEFELGNADFPGAQFNSSNAPGVGSGNRHHFEAKTNPDGTYADVGRLFRNDGRIVDVGAQTWSTQVQHIDAFLYANKRIAGTSRYAMTINGGMAASEIGVLAVYDYSGSYLPSSGYTTTSSNTSWLAGHRTWMNSPPNRVYTDPSDPNVRSDPLKKFILNYDYRLRNGGYGYNLIEGGAGERIFFARGGKVAHP